MGRLNRRVDALEGLMLVPGEELQQFAAREFLSRLTDEELGWLAEPGEGAVALVECSDHPGQACACPERERKALEADPETFAEMERRWAALCARHSEILAREPVSTGSYRGGVW